MYRRCRYVSRGKEFRLSAGDLVSGEGAYLIHFHYCIHTQINRGGTEEADKLPKLESGKTRIGYAEHLDVNMRSEIDWKSSVTLTCFEERGAQRSGLGCTFDALAPA